MSLAAQSGAVIRDVRRTPPRDSTAGIVWAWPNVSGDQSSGTSSGARPKCSAKNRRVYSRWRLMLSPLDMFLSPSTHWLAVTSQRPSPMRRPT